MEVKADVNGHGGGGVGGGREDDRGICVVFVLQDVNRPI